MMRMAGDRLRAVTQERAAAAQAAPPAGRPAYGREDVQQWAGVGSRVREFMGSKGARSQEQDQRKADHRAAVEARKQRPEPEPERRQPPARPAYPAPRAGRAIGAPPVPPLGPARVVPQD